jgi:hypothetical protein
MTTTRMTTPPSTTSTGWTVVAVLLGGFTALVVAFVMWLAWVMSGAFGFTQPVLTAAMTCAAPLTLLVMGAVAAWRRGRGRRTSPLVWIAGIVGVFLVLVLALAGCITAGSAAYDARLHDNVPGPSGCG